MFSLHVVRMSLLHSTLLASRLISPLLQARQSTPSLLCTVHVYLHLLRIIYTVHNLRQIVHYGF